MADVLGSVGQCPRNRKRVPEYVDFDGLSVHLEVFVTTSSFAVFPHASRHPQADTPRTKYKASSWNRAPIGDMPALLTRSLWVSLRFSRVWGAVTYSMAGEMFESGRATGVRRAEATN